MVAGVSARWYLPSDDKGTWLGKKGESKFRLKTPANVGGKLVHDVSIVRMEAGVLGSDLAKQIIDDANKNRDDHLRAINQQVAQAWKEANDQTLDAFHDLAGQIEVTNSPDYHTGQLVDPDEIANALSDYRNSMQAANHLRIAGQPGFNYRAAAAHNKAQLKQALERASQKRAAPSKQGSVCE